MRYSDLKDLSGQELDDELKRQKIIDLIDQRKHRGTKIRSQRAIDEEVFTRPMPGMRVISEKTGSNLNKTILVASILGMVTGAMLWYGLVGP